MVEFYKPVFNRHDGSLKGIVYQELLIESFVDNTMHDINRSSFNIIWHDLSLINSTIMYEHHQQSTTTTTSLTNSFTFRKQIEFAQRIGQLEINQDSIFDGWQTTIDNAFVLSAFIAILFAITSILFIWNRRRQQKRNTVVFTSTTACA